MQASFKDKLSSIINNIEVKKTVKQERINTDQPVNPPRKSMPLIWRIVRNEKNEDGEMNENSKRNEITNR